MSLEDVRQMFSNRLTLSAKKIGDLLLGEPHGLTLDGYVD